MYVRKDRHCVKSVQTRSFFWSVFSRIRTEYGPEKTPYLDTFLAVTTISLNMCYMDYSKTKHCVKSVQIRSFFWSVFSHIRTEYGPEKTPYLDTFDAVR